MPNPFPGMNPYLEGRWEDVHHSLCTYARDALQPQLLPTLVARVGERTVVETVGGADRTVYPDVKVIEAGGGTALLSATAVGLARPLMLRFGSEPWTEGFVSILDPRRGNALVTVIEFLSASNKSPGASQSQYAQKRDQLYEGGVTLVEVDLLRAGRWPFMFPELSVPSSHREPYRACIHRAGVGPEYGVYHLPLQDRLPRIPIPLRAGEPDAILDL